MTIFRVVAVLCLLSVSTPGNCEALVAEYDGTPPPKLIDHAMDHWPKGAPQPGSAWIAKERQAYRRILQKGQFDVLVLPFQVIDFGVSRSVRSLMGAQLALAISQNGKTVADPYTASRALGEGLRQFDPLAVRELAGDVSARQVVQGFVGHDQQGSLKFVIRVTNIDVPGRWHSNDELPVRELTLSGIPISFEHPALLVFEEHMPKILEFLGHAWHGWKPGKAAELAELPDITVADASAHPLTNAVRFQLFGTLTPGRIDRDREIFYEKSLLALYQTRSAEGRALRARALLKLGMRPAALAVLKDPQSNFEEAIVANANGRLPELIEVSKRLKRPYERLIATFDISELQAGYGLYTKEDTHSRVKDLSLPQPWDLLAERKALDWDAWSVPGNRSIKEELDRVYPLIGFDLNTLESNFFLLRPSDSTVSPVEFYPQQHADRLKKDRPDLWCCASFSAVPNSSDYLHLLLAISTDNLLQRAYFYTNVQGQPDKALEILDSTSELFYQQPDFAFERSSALFRKAENQQAEIGSAIWVEAANNAELAFYWEQGQTMPASSAWIVLQRVPRPYSDNSHAVDTIYSGDLPYNVNYPLSRVTHRQGPGEVDQQVSLEGMIERHLAFSVSETSELERFYTMEKRRNNTQGAERIFNALNERFTGNPSKYLWLSSESEASGDTEASIAHLKAGIDRLPRFWPLYEKASDMLVGLGRLEAADELLRTYPPFTDGEEHRVALSNEAYAAGNYFYWRGKHEAASHYYRISAGLQTGSEGSLASGIRLTLSEDDYVGAIQGSMARGNRYRSSYAFRDYLGLLFLLGESAEAWSGFEVLNPQFEDSPHLWESVLSGHRITRHSELEILAWADRYQNQRIGLININNYIARTAVMDRIPGEATIKRVEERAGVHWIPKDSINPAHILDERARPAINGQWPDISPDQQLSVRPDLVYLLEGYRATHMGDFEVAFAHFDNLFKYYRGQLNPNYGFALPYYVLAGVKSNKTAEVDALLSMIGERSKSFDYWLAIAMRSGLAKNYVDSESALNRAVGLRPYTEFRIMFPEYEFADVCDWLWRETDQEAYRSRAIDWARSNQKTQPWQAWPYTLELALTQESGNVALLEKARFLDPASPRLPKSASGKKTAETSNPFLEHVKQQAMVSAKGSFES